LASYADTAGRLCWKQSRQSTGRPCVGLNGTVVSLPHCEQMARVSVLDEPRCPPPLVPKFATRFALQALQRLGSFLNCLSWKNNCSPDVNTKSASQSMHFNILSRNSIEDAPSALSRPHPLASRDNTHLSWRTNAQDFRYIPLSDLAPGFGPPCPWLDMDYFYFVEAALPRGYAFPGSGNAVQKGKGPLPRGGAAQCRLSVLLFSSFFPAALAC
jgi:hypothetical protein